jgi:hypothetical protein
VVAHAAICGDRRGRRAVVVGGAGVAGETLLGAFTPLLPWELPRVERHGRAIPASSWAGPEVHGGTRARPLRAWHRRVHHQLDLAVGARDAAKAVVVTRRVVVGVRSAPEEKEHHRCAAPNHDGYGATRGQRSQSGGGLDGTPTSAHPRAMRWILVVVLLSGCPCQSFDPFAPAFPAEAHLTVRRSTGPDVAPFSTCEGFEGSLGRDRCARLSGSLSGDGGRASASYPPSRATYGYALAFDAERGQLCRTFGDEFGDANGCDRRDVRCASSGEIVITEGGASVVADFPGGGHVEGAWLFPVPADAGMSSD